MPERPYRRAARISKYRNILLTALAEVDAYVAGIEIPADL
jgi:hypothetical protein